MSFEQDHRHKATFGERTDESLDLPPDLAALAQQLSDEAGWIAERYPAQAAEKLDAKATAAATTSRRRRRLARIGLVSGVAAATVLATVLGWQAVSNRDSAVSDGRAPVVEHASQVAQLNDAGGFSRQTGETIGQENVLQGLSGAEQEAVLDLIESHAAHKTSLSI